MYVYKRRRIDKPNQVQNSIQMHCAWACDCATTIEKGDNICILNIFYSIEITISFPAAEGISRIRQNSFSVFFPPDDDYDHYDDADAEAQAVHFSVLTSFGIKILEMVNQYREKGRERIM